MNPPAESVTYDHTQLFIEGFPVIFHKGPFSPSNYILCCTFCADFELGAECLPLLLVVAWEWLATTLGVLGLSLHGAIS